MRRRFRLFILTVLIMLSCTALAPALALGDISQNPIIRVGLFFSGEALPSANLENSVGSGYQFGYFDSSLTFTSLGYTAETKITMLKTQNMYLSAGTYSDNASGGGAQVIGCYHLQMPGSYLSFEDAQANAAQVGGFPAWIDGAYYVRVGAYASSTEAQCAQATLGLAGSEIVGTSSFAVTVVQTGTTSILFQFDGGQALPLAVKPGLDNSTVAVTWFKGYKYYGSFQYQRIGNGNLTVSNIVPLEDYVRGVLPYEMSGDWPLEALKAQAVCARTYAVLQAQTGKHAKLGFDICNTVDCQVYRGINSANGTTDRAVEETYGKYAWYGNSLAQTFYFSSDGGATEDVGNVWRDDLDLPYLKGIVDPHEASVAGSISNYNWSVTFSRQELTELMNRKGYQNAGIVDLKVSEFTLMGNVKSITFTDAAGKSWTMSKESARTFLGLRSQRYTIRSTGGAASGQSSTNKIYINADGSTVSSISGAYAINGSGEIVQVPSNSHLITKDGIASITDTPASVPSGSGDGFVISGSGWGHNVGMSQWGANAMAKAGYSYDEILKFYFTGIDVR